MSNKHTPGPWFVERLESTEGDFSVSTNPDPAALKCYTAVTVGGLSDGSEEANANLIAAAPDLLAALRALFDDYKRLADSGDAGNWRLEDLDEGKQALAALAKAEGR